MWRDVTRGLWTPSLPVGLSRSSVPPPASWHLYTRVTTTTAPAIKAYDRAGDYHWGQVTTADIPKAQLALSISGSAMLANYSDADIIASYSNINFDNEASPASAALAEAQAVDAWVTAFNGRNPGNTVTFTHYTLLNNLTGAPTIVNYGNPIMFGKSQWTDGEIPANAAPYIAQIQAAGKRPAIILGYQDHGYIYTNAEVITNFHRVLDAPPYGTGLIDVGFFYAQDLDSSLLAALGDASLARP